MSAGWIMKTEPGTYSYDDLVRDGRAVWDGVTNPVALKNIRAMAPGDLVLVYHTGDEKAAVGLAKVASAAYADPKRNDPKLVVIDLVPGPRLKRPVTLAAMRAEPKLADIALVRAPRLSVVPADAAQWKTLLAMGGM